jgi:large subunit ribosomal protein L16
MLAPKRTKFRKQQKGRMRGEAKAGNRVSYGDFGLQALECGYITERQIEASRVAISRKVKKLGKLYVRMFPDKPITKKPAETRMGKGKGGNEGYVAVVRPGRVLFEIEGVDLALATAAFLAAHHKLPIRTRIVGREAVA